MHRGTDLVAGATVAIKVVPRSYYALTDRSRESLQREVQILQGLERAGGHPHIVNLISVFDTGPAMHIGAPLPARSHPRRPVSRWTDCDGLVHPWNVVQTL